VSEIKKQSTSGPGQERLYASCSNKIGKKNDGGVVDGNFLVYGTNNLRVVDASVFPNIPGYYPMIPLLMISEKASDVILAAAAH